MRACSSASGARPERIGTLCHRHRGATPLSFQHTEESLLRLVFDSGYIKMMQMRPPHREDYTFYLCLPAQPMDRNGRRVARSGKPERANEPSIRSWH